MLKHAIASSFSVSQCQFEHVGGVLESSGRADFKTVPGFAFRATFEVDIEGLHW